MSPKRAKIIDWIVAIVCVALLAFVFFGCGTTRHEVARITTDETTTATGKHIVTESEKIAKTTLDAPELKAVVSMAAAAVPAVGPIAGFLGYLTGTPDGAALGLGSLGTLGLALAKTLQSRREGINAIDELVKGTSDFMQANPSLAPSIKATNAKVMDQTTKDHVKASRLRQDLL